MDMKHVGSCLKKSSITLNWVTISSLIIRLSDSNSSITETNNQSVLCDNKHLQRNVLSKPWQAPTHSLGEGVFARMLQLQKKGPFREQD